MPTKRWPTPPPMTRLYDGTGCWNIGLQLEPEDTVCKHGKGSCEACGTTNLRDTIHTTKGGRGAVSRLSRR